MNDSGRMGMDKRKYFLLKTLIFLFMFVAALIALFPFYWMFVTIKLFLKYIPKGALDNAVAKLLQINSPGHNFGGKAKISSTGFTAVTNIQ